MISIKLHFAHAWVSMSLSNAIWPRGAPGTFHAVVKHVFFPRIGRGDAAYLDDLLVYSPDVESRSKLLDRVVKTIEDHKMYPKKF